MKSLGILALAAASFIPAAAFAQTVTPPPEEDTPSTTLRTPAPRAASAPAAAPAPRAAPAPAIAQPVPPAPVAVAPTPPARPAGVTWKAAGAPKWAAPAVQVAPAPRVVSAPSLPPRPRVIAAQAPAPLPPPPPMAPPPPPPPPPPEVLMEHAPPPGAWGEVVEETVTIDADGREHRSVIRRPVAPDELAEGGILAPYARMHQAPPAPGYGIDPRAHAYGAYGHPRPVWGPRWGRRWSERHRGGIPEYVGSGNYRPTDEDYARLRRHHGYFYAQPQPGPVVVETTVTTTETVVERPR